jgi:hypothetical protein
MTLRNSRFVKEVGPLTVMIIGSVDERRGGHSI